MLRLLVLVLAISAFSGISLAAVGDPQVKTDHPWYAGELSCSTFERLFATQAEVYERVTGRKVASDEDKALASWFWRNINYFHCTTAGEDVWDQGFKPGFRAEPAREYWKGIFADGYGLCFTTHHQYCAELEALFGPGRCRIMGVQGHTTFEAYLTGGPYGSGQWALLDPDISTVIFTPDGQRLMGLMEVSADMSSVKKSNRDRGWIPGGLYASDPDAYKRVQWAGYSTGYATVPPMVHLRAGETLRRYLEPGLEDGKTFAYWGINYNKGGKPGPVRDLTWVDVPEQMYKSGRASPRHWVHAGNAVYTYKPDFAGGAYKEGVIDEGPGQVTFEFYSPYIIAASPPADKAGQQWGVYESGCTGGLVVTGGAGTVSVSTDQGASWSEPVAIDSKADLTDLVKGHRQYWLRVGAAAKDLAGKGLTIRTVCQCSHTVIPRLKAGVNRITYESSGRGVLSAGPNSDQAAAHIVDGKLKSPAVTLELAAPRGAKAVGVHAAFRAACGSPPRPAKYNIDCSTDGGKTWKGVLKNWQVVRHDPEPNDWWSQTFGAGSAAIDPAGARDGVRPVRVRFTNSANVQFTRVEAHLTYEVPTTSDAKVTFGYKSGGQTKTVSHTYKTAPGKADTSWSFDAGDSPQTLWVEYSAE